jgi:translation initiation factor 2B subunit (eIF-2B alpha/beta/delta family)
LSVSAHLARRVAAIRENRSDGATQLLRESIDVLRASLAEGVVLPVAAALCSAQPSMASVWSAALSAVAASEGDLERFARFVARVERADAALARFAGSAFPDVTAQGRQHPWKVVTLSASRAVRTCLDVLRLQAPVHVSCTESRPALEGRRLAESLSAAGFTVACFTDAAIAPALDDADALLLGADAVGPRHFINKAGSRMLAAAAGAAGTPVYVCATRDKFAMPSLWYSLRMREGTAGEVWDDAPPGVVVRNPYFEETSLSLVTGIVSDMGVLTAEMASDVCHSLDDAALRKALSLVRGLMTP